MTESERAEARGRLQIVKTKFTEMARLSRDLEKAFFEREAKLMKELWQTKEFLRTADKANKRHLETIASLTAENARLKEKAHE